MLMFRAVQAREILDSRGCPTIEACVTLSDGSQGRASVPSGASKGRWEAAELRDGDALRYGGQGVLKAIDHIHRQIQPKLLQEAIDPLDLRALDRFLCELDGTPQKERLGANALLAVSLAAAHAAAHHWCVPLYRVIAGLRTQPPVTPRPWTLPTPQMNVMNGGLHTGGEGLPVQELMVVPFGAPTLPEAIRMGCEIFAALKKSFQKKGYSTAVGDEGGVVAPFAQVEAGFEAVLEAVVAAGYRPGVDVGLALDCAANGWWEEKDRCYRWGEKGPQYDAAALLELYTTWCRHYPIVSIEDGWAEEDWAGFKAQQQQIGDRVQCVGDDLFVTQKPRLLHGIAENAANAILIKLNQVGTLSETIETMETAQAAGWQTIVSHRSGETEDVSLVHLAVGMGAQQVKTGSLSRSERLCKYNALLGLAESLGEAALFAGRKPFKSLWEPQPKP